MMTTRKRKCDDSSNPIKAVTPQDKEDRELDCSICVSLVSDATQSTCCGSIYCKTCIHTWLERDGTCPCCRKHIDKARDLFPDLRTDRKSSECKRGCKNDEHGCAFMGTRRAVAQHELDCQNVPVEVLRNQLEESERTKKQLEGNVLSLQNQILAIQRRESAAREDHELARDLHDALRNQFEVNERTKKQLEASVSSLGKEIVQIQHREMLGDTSRTNEMAAAAWRTPEEILKEANDNQYHVIKFFDLSAVDKTYKFRYNKKLESFKIDIIIANHNVSLWLHPTGNRTAAIIEDITVCLFHPTAVDKNHTGRIAHTFEANGTTSWGILNWMTLGEFKEHVNEGRFAVGV